MALILEQKIINRHMLSDFCRVAAFFHLYLGLCVQKYSGKKYSEAKQATVIREEILKSSTFKYI